MVRPIAIDSELSTQPALLLPKALILLPLFDCPLQKGPGSQGTVCCFNYSTLSGGLRSSTVMAAADLLVLSTPQKAGFVTIPDRDKSWPGGPSF